MPTPPEVLPPADVVAYVLADIAIILIAARIVGTLFEKIRQPRIVGEIIAGILIGPTVLGGALDKAANPDAGSAAVMGSGLTHDLYPLQAFAFLNTIGQIALVLYMFLVGIELEKRLLRGRGRDMTIVALAVTAVPVAFGFLAAPLLESATWRPEGVSTTTFALFLGAGLATTAFPVMARILQEKNLLATPMGAVGIGSAALVTVLMFLVIAAASASAKDAGIVNQTGVRFLLLAALALGLAVVVRPLLGWVVRRYYTEGEPLNGNLLAFLIFGAIAAGLATDRIVNVALLGGFMFGAIAVPGAAGLAQAVIARMSDMVVLFFLPIFLAVSGLRTDLTLLEGKLIGGILLFLALMIVGKLVVGYLAGRAVGLKSDESATIGALMNCRGLLILVVALIGLQLGVITPQMQLAFVIGAIVTTMMTGPLVDRFVPKEKARRMSQTVSVEDMAEADRSASGTASIAR
ncbi:MAG: cation:proton antiporter [Actinomycetota bacterium]